MADNFTKNQMGAPFGLPAPALDASEPNGTWSANNMGAPFGVPGVALDEAAGVSGRIMGGLAGQGGLAGHGGIAGKGGGIAG